MTLDERSESKHRQGSFLLCFILPFRGLTHKKCGRSGKLRPSAFLRQLEALPGQKTAVAVPNATAAVFLRNEEVAPSKAREGAAIKFWQVF